MKTVSTQFGKVTLVDPPGELIQTIRSFLPFGLIRNDPPERWADFGIVMQCGELELLGVRQQPRECTYQQSLHAQDGNNILIAHSLAAYLKAGFSGLFMPCTYIATKQRQMFESGIAYFGYPSQTGRESQEYPFDNSYDEHFDHGFTTMMTSFMHGLHQSSRATGIPLHPTVGLNLQYRQQLGYLDLGFMLVGSQVVCLKTTLAPQNDLTWTALREMGISTVFHLPSQPAAIDPAQLPLAKSSGDLRNI